MVNEFGTAWKGLKGSLKSKKPSRDYGSNIMSMNPYRPTVKRVRVKVKRRPKYRYKNVKTYNYSDW